MEYYEIDNLEILTESLSKIHFVGLTFFIKNFVPKFTIYLYIKDKKYQFESITDMPNEAELSIKEVKEFSIPLNDEIGVFIFIQPFFSTFHQIKYFFVLFTRLQLRLTFLLLHP